MQPETTSQKTLVQCFQRRPDSCWSVNSQEHHKREEALVNLFTETGMSTRLCEQPSFRKFSSLLKPTFKTPGAARLNGLIGAKMDTAKQQLKEIIKEARKLMLCVDGWSKRGLTASFMGVSACFYHPPGGKVHHVLLNLHRMEHPHTGEATACCIDQTLDAWNIGEDRVLLVVADNGANIVKAVRMLRHEDLGVPQAQPGGPGDGQHEQWMESDSEEESDEGEESIGFDGEHNKFQRMSCLAHTLQLTLKDAMKHPSADSLIVKARKLVHAIRKSSVANEELIKRCGKTLVRDCSTRWNSTYDMLKRLLDIRAELNQLLEELGMDTLLASDWAKMENLIKLFEPFPIHTDQLQSDSQSLSQVVPCLLNLEAHLQMNLRNQLA
ncbi:E3 SUMO-protein ligase ZBED1-like isoform X2 [Amphiprion ocellaris]|uniref:E3 SUMO-protein ligase ZBED1-like isoform X2 n=1 Tax=Amphiprion ocellaris TaxID=80972 RepID=UPI0024112309|nr:E3 SUMO-protein ligase ZBED1-like isoform X2 [Amphiprion ocellaris]